jgi:hypothetical protein
MDDGLKSVKLGVGVRLPGLIRAKCPSIQSLSIKIPTIIRINASETET